MVMHFAMKYRGNGLHASTAVETFSMHCWAYSHCSIYSALEMCYIDLHCIAHLDTTTVKSKRVQQ